jgi:competence protein ComEC
MPNKFYKILLILGIVAVLVAIPAFWLTYSAASDLEVDFLDIGQGDAILIKTPYGQNVLVDGGPDNAIIKRLSENMPWWDKTVDLMILTHPHDDHVGGLNDVLKRYKVKKILYTGVVHNSPAYIKWLELIKDQHIPLVIIDRAQTITFGPDCQLDILYPHSSLLGREVDNLNNSSIVAKLIYEETKFLLTGDAEMEVEQELVNSQADLPAQVMKAGHHGSDTSNSEEFLKAVHPEIVVIQVGADNQFGHPSLRVIKRLERIGVKVYRNDLDGTVHLYSDGQRINFKNE